MLVEKYLKEQNERDQIIQQLKNKESEGDTSFLEKVISTNLEFYITNHPELLASLDVETLYNIFNNQERFVRDENIAAQFILESIENGKEEFAVLLSTVNCENIDQSLIQRIINTGNEYIPPNIRKETMKNFYSFIEETNSKILEDHEALENEMKQNIQNLETRINNKMQDEQERQQTKEREIDQKFQTIQESIDKLTSLMSSIQSSFEEFKREQENQIHDIKKVDELSSIINTLASNAEPKIQNFSKFLQPIFRVFSAITMKSEKVICRPAPSSQNGKMRQEGILACLKAQERGFRDHQFITKLSRRDPYSILLPNSNDYYASSKNGRFFAEIEFESAISVKGIIIKNGSAYFMKGFKVIVNSEEEVYSTSGIEALNHEYAEAKIEFNSCQCKKIKIEQAGPNFQYKNFIRFKRLDVITEDAPDGYFKSIIPKFADVHLLPIKLNFDAFSTDDYYSLNPKKFVSSHFANGTDGFFEVEFVSGLVFAEAYRLRRREKSEQMKAWMIEGQLEDDGEWLQLDEREEETKFQFPSTEVYELRVKGIFKRIRIRQTQKTWDNTEFFRLEHFDIFGKYYLMQ